MTLVSLSLIVASSCGGGSSDKGTKTAAGKTSTTEAGGDATTTTAAETTTTPPGPGSTVKPAGTVEPGGYGWRANASDYRGLDGKQFEFGCPPGGAPEGIYGTGVYTDDSSVCSAAVHAGKITAAEGGQVIIATQPGQPSYKGSSANGVESSEFGAYGGSYQVVDDKPFAGTSEPQAGGYGWKVTSSRQDGLDGQTFRYSCPPAGDLGSVWGTGTYTNDSSVCSAAVHAGKITRATGGTAVIQIKGKQDKFEGSTANGVTSSEYGPWPSSFSFVG
jgi:hypothetical protein